jgi:nicotinate-nucleotide pyrophosphorylase (carboxylating)
VVAKANGILAGGEVAAEVFRRVERSTVVSLMLPDGSAIAPGAFVMEVTGMARAILTAERTALNFVQRLSGVATMARRFVDAVRGTGATIIDTRKTTPGWRVLEKAAVVAGGAQNHRMGLYDPSAAVMGSNAIRRSAAVGTASGQSAACQRTTCGD